MRHDGLSRSRAAVRAACTLPLFAISFFAAGLKFTCTALAGRLLLRHDSDGTARKAAWAAEEFRFECAIEKYEDLIDSIARSRK